MTTLAHEKVKMNREIYMDKHLALYLQNRNMYGLCNSGVGLFAGYSQIIYPGITTSTHCERVRTFGLQSHPGPPVLGYTIYRAAYSYKREGNIS